MRISSLGHATEDVEKVARAVLSLCPEGFPRRLETARLKGHYGNEIVMLQARTSGASKSDRFLGHFWSRLSPEQRREILQRIEDQLDQAGVLHLRLDKQSLYLGHIVLDDSDPVKMEIRFGTKGLARGAVAVRVRSGLGELVSSGRSEENPSPVRVA